MAVEFWRTKTLDEMTPDEWEALCDGCGQCCRVKLEDVDSGAIAVTDVVCRLLDIDTCRCGDYPRRHQHVADCVRFDASVAQSLTWLPETCAYRLVAAGEPLPPWHPLITGDPDTVHAAGASVRRAVVSEDEVASADLEYRVLRWVDAPVADAR
jgi:uncharacterized protein